MSSVPCSSSIRFLYWLFSFIDVDTLLALGVECLPPPVVAAPQFKAVLIATPQMRSESGLTFRSKQSAVWPADPRGRRGGREPAGKTCYLPRFHIMDRILSPFRRDGQASGRIVGNPDITPTFEFCPVGGHSPETRTVGVFLFGLV